MQEKAGISDEKMYNTFNMGIGMVLAVNPSDADDIIIAAGECGDKAVKLGAVVKGKEVIL